MTLTPTIVARETGRRVRHQQLLIGEEIHRFRTEAGVSLGAISDATGVHKSHIARIETGRVNPSLRVLTAIGVALGADLSLRYFPGAGPRLHDRFQAAMIEALLRSIDRRWRVELEVSILRPARGVIDMVLTDSLGPTVIACEVYSELRRLEQQIRWSSEKADGLSARARETDTMQVGRSVSRLLVLRSTVSTREIARRYEATLATAYPARTNDAFLALATPSAPWPGPSVVWMRHHGRTTALMAVPPPGVRLGRDRGSDRTS